MAKKKKSNATTNANKLNKQWTNAANNLKRRIETREKQGYKIEYNIKKPEKVTASDIEWLNKQVQGKTIPKSKSTKKLDLKVEKLDLETVAKPTKPTRKTKAQKEAELREQLISEGFREESIDYFLNEEGMTMQEVAEELRAGEAESKRIEMEEEIAATSINGYFYDPETGEKFSPNDPRIIQRKRKGGWEMEWNENKQQFMPKVKSNLEFHSGEPLSQKDMEELQWSNFIGNFEVAEQFGHLDINVAAYYREMREKIGQTELMHLLNETSDFSSNIGDISWWYEASQKDQIDKLQSLISLAQRTTGKDLSNLSKELADYSDTIDDSTGYSIGGELRQQNRAYRHRLR